MDSPAFAKNQIVFARIRGYPCWPGKIHDFCTTSKAIHYVVYLYGFDRLMKFNANQLLDYGDYIQKNTNKICDLLLYVRAIEEAQEDFRFSQNVPSPEAPVAGSPKESEFPVEKDYAVENVEFPVEDDCAVEYVKSYQPLLRSMLKKQQNLEDSEYLSSQQCDGELEELHAELKLLRYDYYIKSYTSLKKVNLKKCLAYLSKLRALRLTRFILSRNPQILRTLKLLRKYTGDSRKWKLTSGDRENFHRVAQKIRELASIILKSFKRIAASQNRCPENVSVQADANENSKKVL